MAALADRLVRGSTDACVRRTPSIPRAAAERNIEPIIEHSSGSSKPTKTQKENEVIKGAILEVLTDEGQTASEILAQMPEGLSEKALTNQRVSALLRQLIADNKVVKSIEKKTSYFSLA